MKLKIKMLNYKIYLIQEEINMVKMEKDKIYKQIDKFFEKRQKMIEDLELKKERAENFIRLEYKLDKYLKLKEYCDNKLEILKSGDEQVRKDVSKFCDLLLDIQDYRILVNYKKKYRYITYRLANCKRFDENFNGLKQRMLYYILYYDVFIDEMFNSLIDMILEGFNLRFDVDHEKAEEFEKTVNSKMHEMMYRQPDDVTHYLLAIEYKWNEVKKFMKNNYKEDEGKED